MKSFVLKLSQQMNQRLLNFNAACEAIASKNYFTNVYGLARTLLAIGTLITLTFNTGTLLFPEHLFNRFEFGHFLEDLNLFYLIGYENLWVSKLLAIGILITVISGYFPRFTGVLHWWVSFSFFHAAAIVDGGDQATSVLTLLLIPMTLLDGRKNHWIKPKVSRAKSNFVVFVTLVVIELQVAIIYLLAGIEKPFKVSEWVDGTAVYYWLNHNVFGTSDLVLSALNPLMEMPYFISAMTWGTIIFELVLFGAFFMARDKRKRLLKYAILFHFTIIIFHGLVSFFFAMSAALVLFLLPKDKWLTLPWQKLKISKLFTRKVIKTETIQ